MSAQHAIPPITDSLGKGWRAPDLTGLDVRGTYALLSPSEFKALPEYSTTMPSGVYPGKAWKANAMTRGNDGRPVPTDRWLLRWFGIVPGNDRVCSNNQLEIIVVGGHTQ